MPTQPKPDQYSFQRLCDLMRPAIDGLTKFVDAMNDDPSTLANPGVSHSALDLLAGHLEQNGFAPEGEQFRSDAEEFFRAYLLLVPACEWPPEKCEKALSFAGGFEHQRTTAVLLAKSMYYTLKGVVQSMARGHLGPDFEKEGGGQGLRIANPAVGPRVNTPDKQGSGPKDAELLASIPPLDANPTSWVSVRDAAKGISTKTLRNYRLESMGGIVAPDGMSGIDREGRMWRKHTTRNSQVRYFKPSLPNYFEM